MNFINITCVILIIACICILLKKYACEYALIINIFLGFSIVLYLISNFTETLNHIKNLIHLTNVSEKYLSILFKSLLICFVTQFSSDACKDAGEFSLSTKIEILGKFSIIATSLPLFEEVTELVINFMGVT